MMTLIIKHSRYPSIANSRSLQCELLKQMFSLISLKIILRPFILLKQFDHNLLMNQRDDVKVHWIAFAI